jgi:heptosyltransferase-1
MPEDQGIRTSLAQSLGLLRPEIVPAKNGEPTLRSAEHYLLSAYDPRRDALRKAALDSSPRVRIVGLGLGYLALALGERLSGVLSFEGEIARLKRSGPAGALDALASRVTEYDSIPALERALLDALKAGDTIMIDPSLEAAPTIRDRIQDLIRMIITAPHAVIVHLRTAGDVIRCMAAVQAFRAANPTWTITFVTERPYGEVAALAEGIDRVIELAPDATSIESCPRPLIAFNLGGEAAASALAKSLDPLFFAGYDADSDRIILRDDRDPRRADELATMRNHMNRYHLAYAILGLPFASDAPSLRVKRAAAELNIVQFGAGSGEEVWAPKRLDPAVIGDAIRRVPGHWIAVGGEIERAAAEAAGIPEADNLCGKTTWPELARLLARARLYVGHDSGPTHLAAALGVPTLALFGFTSPILNAPIGPRVLTVQMDMACAFSGCRVPCPERTCTGSYTPNTVVLATEHLLAEARRERLATAAQCRDAGLRLFYPGMSVEDPDPLRALMLDEPTMGAPRDAALALAREWLSTMEWY